jgi:hypothetical protein
MGRDAEARHVDAHDAHPVDGVGQQAQQAEPERIVATRRIRSPTRKDPKAGHMLCGLSCGPWGWSAA